jgi:hypothetical protein
LGLPFWEKVCIIKRVISLKNRGDIRFEEDFTCGSGCAAGAGSGGGIYPHR